MTIVVVTGSRSLECKPHAKRWVIETMRAHLVEPARDWLFVGDATDGPDSWAAVFALNNWFRLRVFLAQRAKSFAVAPPHSAQSAVRPWESHPDPKRRPLVRNAEMLRLAREESRLTHEPLVVLGFVDPESLTFGTRHTLGRGRAVGATVLEHCWTQRVAREWELR